MSEDAPEESIAEGSGPHELPAEPEPLASAAPEADEPDDDVGDEAVSAELPQALDDAALERLVEALVFAAERPVTVARLRQLTRIADVRRIEQALAALAEHYRERGIALAQVSGGYQFRTATPFSSYVQQLVAGRPVRLTRAQLETLAIIAYRQPITRPEIDDIRGVDSSNTLRVLAERSLVRILGKKEEVGRPLLYGTTKEFLDFFSLADLRELPTLREYSELTAESRQAMTEALGEAEEQASGLGPQASGQEEEASGCRLQASGPEEEVPDLAEAEPAVTAHEPDGAAEDLPPEV